MKKNNHTILEIRRFNRFYTEILGLLDQHVLESPYSLTEARIILEIYKIKDCTANKLMNKLHIDRGYLSRILNGFEKKGLIRKENFPTDRRFYFLYLTQKGKDILNDLENKSNQHVQALVAPLTGEEQGKLLDAMKHIENALSSTLHSINIRSFRPNDIDWVVQKHVDLYETEYGFDNTFRQYVEEAIYKFQEDFRKEKDNLWIAEVNGKPEGMIAIVKVDDETAQLRWFLIDPKMRGKGLGNKLMSTAIDFCKKSNYQHVLLWTISILDAARHLYERYGFTLSETVEHNVWGKDLIEERWDLSL
ncbi:MAG: helix-turn-helix domain-containing GNAT family N-acetyltransferase [Clostridia bacterium]|nr:helix-turn-helix domain-containing GNAT family N-acetyltransferase [Clostridia bacterium]